MDSEKILEILEKSKGYEIALMTTFNFEVDFFEKSILSRLLSNKIKKVSLFVDSKELAKAVKSAQYSALGKKYAINPVIMQGSFHPKMILLLGETKARLIVSSANLKVSGYYVNNEVFNSVDYDPDHQEFRDVIYSAISFFQSLDNDSTCTYRLDDSLLSLSGNYRYYRQSAENGRVFLLHNLSVSILEQMLEIISSPVQELHIAVPYYDNDLSALQRLQTSFYNAEFHLYLQQKKSTFPGIKFFKETCKGEIHIFEKMNVSGKENGRFYHGKVFLIKTETSSYVLYGSSNCTQSALIRTKENGNVECNLLIKGDREEFDPFFSGFIECRSALLDSHLMTFDAAPKDNFYFMYGEADNEIKLHIGYRHKKENVTFFIDEIPLECSEDKEHIVIKLDYIDSSVFNVRAEYDDENEIICCWYNDYRALTLFRIDTYDEISLADKEDYASGDKFKEEYEKLLQAEMACVEDIDEWERITRSVIRPSDGIENDATEPDEEDFIVHVEINDEDYAYYQQFKIVEHIRGRIKARFLRDLTIPLYYSGTRDGKSVITADLEKQPSVQKRQATTEEKRFERFVKRKVSSYIDDGKQSEEKKRWFIERLSYDHYFGIVTTLLEIIQKNRINDELLEDIFVDSYVVPTRIKLLETLIRKYDTSEDSSEDLIRLVLATVLDNHVRIVGLESANDRGFFEMKNRSLLKILETRFSLRTCYEKYLLSLENGVFTKEAQAVFEGARQYIDSLYGYKDISQIRSYLFERYGEKSSLEIEKKTVKIMIYINDPKELTRPDDELVREISKYSQNVYKLSTIRLMIFGNGDSKIDRIEHTINLEYRKLTTNIIRKSGINTFGKPQYYSF